MSPDLPGGGLGDALAAALADVEALAVEKEQAAERAHIREAVQQLTADGTAQVGPAIRGMPSDEAAPRPDGASGGCPAAGGSSAGRHSSAEAASSAMAGQVGRSASTPRQSASSASASAAAPAAARQADQAALRLMRQQHEQLRRQLEDERAQAARLSRQLEDVRGDLKATRQRFRRLADQYEELQRRHGREEQTLPTRLRKQILQNLLPALDALDLVSHNLLDDVALSDALSSEQRTGIEMMRAAFQRSLQLNQVVAFDAMGQRFDPVVHEAISEAYSDDVVPGTVLRQVGRGYLLEGKLLRSAQVVVARGPEA